MQSATATAPVAAPPPTATPPEQTLQVLQDVARQNPIAVPEVPAAPVQPTASEVWTQWLDDKVLQLANAVSEAAAKYGEQALELVLLYARLDAMSKIVGNALWLVLWLSLARIAYLIAKRNYRAVNKHNDNLGDETGEVFATWVGGAGTVVFSLLAIVAVFHVFDFWNWVGLFSPELYLAHEGLEVVKQRMAPPAS